MSHRIYTVTQVSPTTGKPLRGAPTRNYRAESAREAGRLYAAGQGLPNPVLAARYDGNAENEFFTFKPTAPQGSFLRVRVQQVTNPRPPRKGTKVQVNALYLTRTFVGMSGKVESSGRGDDGQMYVTVDFGTQTWPFLVTELDTI
jgi:hypothetical protein